MKPIALPRANCAQKRGLFELFPVKTFLFAVAFVFANLFFLSTAFAAKRVTNVTYGGQTGTATAGTATSVTYTITLSEAGAALPVPDAFSLTWAGGPPAGVTYTLTSATETSVTNTSFTPSGINGATLTLTITTTNATPAVTKGFTIVITDNNGGGGPYTSAGLSLVVGAATTGISYTGSPFTFSAGTAIATLTPTVIGSPVSFTGFLPAGLTLNAITGVISGTPTTPSGANTYTITAHYLLGVTATDNIVITILAPAISYAGSPFIYYTGTAIAALTPFAVNGTPVIYSGALPAGLTLNAITGVISGTPAIVAAAANFTIIATYGSGVTATATINISVLAPTISYAGSPFTYYKGTTIAALTPTFTGSPTSFSGALPPGLTLNAATGVITGTPTTVAAAANFTITANYSGGVTAAATINITVLAPTLSYAGSPYTFFTGTAIGTLTPAFTGSPTSFSGVLPPGLSLNAANGQITGTPTTVAPATNFTITANYTGGVTAAATINITITVPPPVISYSPSTNVYTVGVAITPLTPSNTGGTAASYSISVALPAGLSFSTVTGVISGTPTAISVTTTYTITATNAGGTGSTTVTLTVNPQPPVISYTPSSNVYTVGVAITPLTPANTGGAATSYSISAGLPAGLVFNTATGVISGTATVTSAATTYTITATNAGGSGTAMETIEVDPPAPIISYTPSTNVYTVGAAIAPLSPTNTGGAATAWIIGPALPAGLSFDTATGIISGTPTAVSAATVYTISADNIGGTGTTSITLSCVLPGTPIISYTPSTNVYTVGTTIPTLTPANPGGAATSFSISTALPAGLFFNTSTGVISGTPTAVSATTTYTITATNASGSGTTTVTLTVNPQAPVISYTPSTNVYTVGTPISPLTPANTGGPATSYTISAALPAGLSFNTATGVISGTPTVIFAVTTFTITAVNSTGSGTTTVTLSANHNPPVITYSPATVIYPVGATIAPATPVNTGGAAISFSISAALPAGLSFNTSTGIISGTPTVVFPTTTFSITATNTAGSSTTSLIITVSPSPPIISYTPSTNAYPVGAPIATLAPVNTGGPVVGYAYAAAGTLLTGATLRGPSLMTIDAAGNIYVANYNNGTISRWNSANTYLGTYTTGRAFANPEGIVFDSSGNCYVEDTGNGAIYKFNAAGVYVSTIISGLSHPLGISIDASNNLYIATYLFGAPFTSSVTKYSTAGVLLQTLPNGAMNESDGVAVDQASGIIYVLNRANNLPGVNQGYVSYYNAAGTYLGTFSSGYSDPLAISVDPSGNVFVADSHNNDVKIYSPTGVLLNTITGFNDVEGFVADANGNLYVSDFTNNTVKEFMALGGYHINAPLPPGLSFNSTNGQITGTPTSVFPATVYTITAYNVSGSGSTTVTLSCYDAYDWIGVTSTDWNTPSNWLSGLVPSAASQANIGVNRTFNFFPNVLTSDGIVNVGSIVFGNIGSQAPGVVVNTGAVLNVSGSMTYQSDASAGLGYTCLVSGAGILNTNNIAIIANTTSGSSYTATMASSVTNLNITANISLTSSNSGAAIYKAAFKITGGTTLLTGTLQTTNTATGVSSFTIIPSTTATLQLANATALSGLSVTGTNVVTFNNTGATVNYSGAAQTVYTDAPITGLAGGVSYQNIAFSGTGLTTALSGNMTIAGDFTNTMANDLSNFVNLSAPSVNFTGTTQTLAGGPLNGTKFYKTAFSGAGTKTMSSGNFYVADKGVLTMSGSNPLTILNAGGLLTLQSSSTSTASVAAIAAGPSITGNVNVQRYITGGPGYRGYRIGSSPVYAATVGANYICSINYLQNSMYLTGAAGGGFDKTGNPTIYLFREDQVPNNSGFTTGNFWGISAINNTPAYNYSVTGGATTGTFNLPAGNGFLYFFRGDRGAASLAVETTPAYTNPVPTIATTAGILNQGQVTVHDWYTPGSANIGYTGSGAGTNFAVRGFNLVGNPYASSIDWESYNTSSTTTGIYANNVGITAYEFNDINHNYAVYQKGGIYTNRGKRIIVSGQGFFVLASNNINPKLIFNETAKTTAQNTGLSLFMSAGLNPATLINAGIDQHLRLQMALDSMNTDDIYIGFNSSASSKYVQDEDAPYKKGDGLVSLSSFSSDSVKLAISKMPLPRLQQQAIPLFVTAKAYGTYSLNMTEMAAIPQIYEVWLMDKYKKDSLDMRHNPTYAFDITADTNSYGSNRFQLVIRQNPALSVHLLNFAATKALAGSQVVWITENEENYTGFSVERSTDGGTTYVVIGAVPSNSQGTYSFFDQNPQTGANMYRLKIADLNGSVTYSNVVTLMYGDIKNSLVKTGITLYPNPAKSIVNLSIEQGFKQNNTNITLANGVSQLAYNVRLTNVLGLVIKTASISQLNWQTDVSNLMLGTYVIEVVNKTDDSVVGQAKFIKL